MFHLFVISSTIRKMIFGLSSLKIPISYSHIRRLIQIKQTYLKWYIIYTKNELKILRFIIKMNLKTKNFFLDSRFMFSMEKSVLYCNFKLSYAVFKPMFYILMALNWLLLAFNSIRFISISHEKKKKTGMFWLKRNVISFAQQKNIAVFVDEGFCPLSIHAFISIKWFDRQGQQVFDQQISRKWINKDFHFFDEQIDFPRKKPLNK